MSFSQTAYNSKHPDVPICFKADEWEDDQGKSYIKHRLDPEDLTSEKVSCAYEELRSYEPCHRLSPIGVQPHHFEIDGEEGMRQCGLHENGANSQRDPV